MEDTLRINAIVSYDYEPGTWNVTDKREPLGNEAWVYEITRKGDGQVKFWIRRKDLNRPGETYFERFRDQAS